jgi:hypothetical protein
MKTRSNGRSSVGAVALQNKVQITRTEGGVIVGLEEAGVLGYRDHRGNIAPSCLSSPVVI